MSGLGVAIGPLVGGFLLEHFWWGVDLPGERPDRHRRRRSRSSSSCPTRGTSTRRELDLVGTRAGRPSGLVALLYGIIEGPSRGWTDPLVDRLLRRSPSCCSPRSCSGSATPTTRSSTSSFFKNPRFTAASIAVTLVFFAMFGTMFFVSQYLQFVLGLLAHCKSGAALMPIAVALMIAAPLSARLVAPSARRRSSPLGLRARRRRAAAVLPRSPTTSGYALVGAVLVIVGVGHGPGDGTGHRLDHGVAAAREGRRRLGDERHDTRDRRRARRRHPRQHHHRRVLVANRRRRRLPGAAGGVAGGRRRGEGFDRLGRRSSPAQLPAEIAQQITAAANQAFVDALDRTAIVAAIVALLGAAIAYSSCRRTPTATSAIDELVDGAALRLLDDPEQRLSLARSALGLLADAGMSSLTYNAIAARSGIATATLQRYWVTGRRGHRCARRGLRRSSSARHRRSA